MEDLIIAATAYTPSVNFQARTGVFSIEGKSFPENVNEFYNPVLEYLSVYSQNPTPVTTITFMWLYYNTATLKMIVDMLLICKQMNSQLNVNWVCAKDNELMVEKGEELREILDLNMKIYAK